MGNSLGNNCFHKWRFRPENQLSVRTKLLIPTNRRGTFQLAKPLLGFACGLPTHRILRLFPEGRLSRHCHCSRGKTLKNRKQNVNTEEKLTLALHRNFLILLGKPPLRQIVIKLLKWLLTEGLAEFPPRKFRDILGVRNACFGALLVHSSLQMGSFSAIDSVPGHSKQMKRGEYKQGR